MYDVVKLIGHEWDGRVLRQSRCHRFKWRYGSSVLGKRPGACRWPQLPQAAIGLRCLSELCVAAQQCRVRPAVPVHYSVLRRRHRSILDLLSEARGCAGAVQVPGGVSVQAGVVARTVGRLLQVPGPQPAHLRVTHAGRMYLVRTIKQQRVVNHSRLVIVIRL